MTSPAHDDALESFFAAARADDQPPRTALVSAILADAAEVQAARAAAPARWPARRLPARRWRITRALEPLGGLGALVALSACAALGFWLGAAGTLTLDGTTLAPGVGSETAAEGVDAFFDYASLEE